MGLEVGATHEIGRKASHFGCLPIASRFTLPRFLPLAKNILRLLLAFVIPGLASDSVHLVL